MAEVISSLPSQHDSPPYYSSTPLRHTPSPKPPLTTNSIGYAHPSMPGRPYRRSDEESSSDLSSRDSSPPARGSVDITLRSPLHSTPPSSLSLDARCAEEEIYFPSYNDNVYAKPLDISNPPASPVVDDYYEASTYEASASSVSGSSTTNDSSVDSPEIAPVADDTAVREEPSRQVDYLSHDWREEDIWSSWKHIVSRRRVYGERSRLENASWRTWAKSKYNLKTVSPETLNWLKECDVTWLYGPLQEGQVQRIHATEPNHHLVKSNSFLTKKPILKKRTISEVMLQKSISTSSLVKQAAAAVQAQRTLDANRPTRPRPSRAISDFTGRSTPAPFNETPTIELPSPFQSSSTSGLESPEGGRRHIRFDDKVEQCIAVDFESGGADEDDMARWMKESDDSSDDELVMMNTKPKRHPAAAGGRTNSFNSQDGKGIAMLPSTKLKYHHDEPDCPGHADKVVPQQSWNSTGKMQSSPSQETLRPSRPSANFLLDDDADDDDADMSWEPSGAFGGLRRDSIGTALHHPTQEQTDIDAEGDGEDESKPRIGMRRTPSGMFMPLDEEEEDGFANTGILGRVVDTVNTARDIAHVIWNVGWRK